MALDRAISGFVDGFVAGDRIRGRWDERKAAQEKAELNQQLGASISDYMGSYDPQVKAQALETAGQLGGDAVLNLAKNFAVLDQRFAVDNGTKLLSALEAGDGQSATPLAGNLAKVFSPGQELQFEYDPQAGAIVGYAPSEDGRTQQMVWNPKNLRQQLSYFGADPKRLLPLQLETRKLLAGVRKDESQADYYAARAGLADAQTAGALQSPSGNPQDPLTGNQRGVAIRAAESTFQWHYQNNPDFLDWYERSGIDPLKLLTELEKLYVRRFELDPYSVPPSNAMIDALRQGVENGTITFGDR